MKRVVHIIAEAFNVIPLFLLSLFVIIHISCAGAPEAPTEPPPPAPAERPDVKDADMISKSVAVSLFDGITLSRVYRKSTPYDISEGYYGALFFTRDGYYPQSRVFKSSGGPLAIDVPPLKELEHTDMGILTGIVYKPVLGGKIREHRGIFQVHKNENIELVRGVLSIVAESDENGIYMVELFPGEYRIRINGVDRGTAEIDAGITTIRNIQKGIVIMD